MAGKDSDKRPIIIKKIKKGGHGHHGGAWKVAYADFVTAMMAFFLLLWLLSSSSKATLEGLAEYFTPTQGIKDSQGIGFDGGIGNTEKGKLKGNFSTPGVVVGNAPQGEIPEITENKAKTDAEADSSLFKKGSTSVQQKFQQDASLQQYQDNVSVSMTVDGLQIDIMDSDKYGMFEPATANLTDHGKRILLAIAPLLKKMPNFMSFTGHTDASPMETSRQNYGNWELSADRAHTARRFLMTQGNLEEERPKKVIGMADRELYTPQEPRGPKNRRVTLLMMRGSHILIPDVALPHADPAVAEPEPAPAATPPAPAAEPHGEEHKSGH